MNVWIFAISALFTPVVEPLGISADQVEAVVVAEPTPPAPMRYHGIERIFEQLEAETGPQPAL